MPVPKSEVRMKVWLMLVWYVTPAGGVPERTIRQVFGRLPVGYEANDCGMTQVLPLRVAPMALLLALPGELSLMVTSASTRAATAAKSERRVRLFPPA